MQRAWLQPRVPAWQQLVDGGADAGAEEAEESDNDNIWKAPPRPSGNKPVYSPGVKADENWLEDEIVQELKLRPPDARALPGANNVIAIASGKGGVGKSTTAVNLAVALDRAGAKAGILDADIYGPSQGIMLGIREGQRPEIRNENQFVPMRCHGIEAISMSMLVTDKTPMVWRGPMASGALQQLLQQLRMVL